MSLLQDLERSYEEIPIGSLWRHLKTDTLYTVKDIAVIESDLTFAVSYTRLGDTSRLHWIRPLDEFLDGRFKREILFRDEVTDGSDYRG